MSIARRFTQTATVKPFLGRGTTGPIYGPTQTIACFVNDAHIRMTTPTGDELVSHTTLYAPLATLDAFKPGSEVTLADRTAHVAETFRRDSAGPPSGHHVQVSLV